MTLDRTSLLRDEIKRTLNVRYLYREFFHEDIDSSVQVAFCPFHDHNRNTPSFHFRHDDMSWHCYSCLRGGDVITFTRLALLRKTGRTMSYRRSLEILARIAGVTIDSDTDAMMLWAKKLKSGTVRLADHAPGSLREWSESVLRPLSLGCGEIATERAFEMRAWMWDVYDRIIAPIGRVSDVQRRIQKLKAFVESFLRTSEGEENFSLDP